MKTIRGSTSTFMMDANGSQSIPRVAGLEQISEIRTDDGVAYAVD